MLIYCFQETYDFQELCKRLPEGVYVIPKMFQTSSVLKSQASAPRATNAVVAHAEAPAQGGLFWDRSIPGGVDYGHLWSKPLDGGCFF